MSRPSAPAGDDPLYESVSAGRKTQGMEHWLPLFYDHLDTLFDYLPRCLVMLGHQAEEAKTARLELVADYYEHNQYQNGTTGPVTLALQREFFGIVNGTAADRHNLFTPVPVRDRSKQPVGV